MASQILSKLPERNLDVLRAVAVLCVLVSHVAVLKGWNLGIVTPYELGHDGVLLFFVHTSLVLMGSLGRSGGGKGWVRAFYLRRAWRIYPLSIATVILVAIVGIPAMPERLFHPATLLQLGANVSLTQNLFGVDSVLGPLWSLPLEMQMYLLLPLLYVCVRRLGSRGLAALWVGSVFVGLAQAYSQPRLPVAWRLNMFAYAPCFVAGVVAYRLCTLRKASIPAWVWPLILFGLLAVYPQVVADVQRAPERGWWLCIVVAVPIPLVRELSISRLTRTAAVIARYSYGIYLLHVPALWLAFVVLSHLPEPVKWCVFVSLVVALPWAAYTAIEHPGINMGRRTTRRADDPVAATVGAPECNVDHGDVTLASSI